MNKLIIVYAAYGGADVTDTVRRMYAEKKGTLQWGPHQYHTTLGHDPFPGVYKTFVVVTKETVPTTVPPRMRVSCYEDEYPMDIDTTVTTTTTTIRKSSAIVSANYGGLDVTTLTQDKWVYGVGLALSEPHTHFGDPLSDVVKPLVVTYLTRRENGIPSRSVDFLFDGDGGRINIQSEPVISLQTCVKPSDDLPKMISISNHTRMPIMLCSHYMASGSIKFENILLSGSKNHEKDGLHILAGETVVAWATNRFSGVLCLRNPDLWFYLGGSNPLVGWPKADVWIRTNTDDDLTCTKAQSLMDGTHTQAGSCTSRVDNRGRYYWDLSEKETGRQAVQAQPASQQGHPQAPWGPAQPAGQQGYPQPPWGQF